MGIKVRVRRNFNLKKELAKSRLTPQQMKRAGTELAVRVENRTLAGKDENGQPFAPLARPKYGRDRADLHDTGKLFEDFGVVQASSTGFGLGFRTARSARIANYHQEGTRKMPARPFLGVPVRWVTDILRRLVRRRR